HKSSLGVRKVNHSIFQQQAQLAKKEEDLREQGMLDEESIGRYTRNEALKTDPTSVNIPTLPKPGSMTMDLSSRQQETRDVKQDLVEQDRLGMMSLSLNDKSGSSRKKQPEPEQDTNEEHYARDRFGNAKSISSDQYFNRDVNDDGINTARLSHFQGSNSISSDQFFNRLSKPQNNTMNPLSKKLLKAATKGVNKLQNMLADLE
ncbi:hypothetical protein BDF20DRAFT_796110, partial [Mycotypha africana]|uniref:uncharacterized protein n=1 Tax=Mycotypha africana TaxID=64632 RepID=UPI0022FFEEB5